MTTAEAPMQAQIDPMRAHTMGARRFHGWNVTPSGYGTGVRCDASTAGIFQVERIATHP